MPDAPATHRYREVDVLKAVGILAVILIHSLRAPWDAAISNVEVWLGELTRFAVPAFLAASGFLYATTSPVSWALTARRLRRVLVPYLIASAAAQLWWMMHDQARELPALLRELLLASSFGLYYYVFLILGLILVTPLLARSPRLVLVALFAVLLASQALLETRILPWFSLFWLFRTPPLWWAYFLFGWLVRLEHRRIAAFVVAHRVTLAATLVVGIGGAIALRAAVASPLLARGAVWLNIYLILALLLVASWARRGSPATLRLLSDSSYAIYLLHLFFVLPLQNRVGSPPGELVPAAVIVPWLAGLLGSLAVIALVRLLFGRRARDLIGA